MIADVEYKTQTTGPEDGLLEGRDTSDPCAGGADRVEAMPARV